METNAPPLKTVTTVNTNNAIGVSVDFARIVPEPAQSQFLNPDAAASTVLALITDTTNDLRHMPTEAFTELRRRNTELLEAPNEVIRESLVRQIVLLEAVWVRYLAKALKATNINYVAAFNKMALSAQSALMSAQSALIVLSEKAAAANDY